VVVGATVVVGAGTVLGGTGARATGTASASDVGHVGGGAAVVVGAAVDGTGGGSSADGAAASTSVNGSGSGARTSAAATTRPAIPRASAGRATDVRRRRPVGMGSSSTRCETSASARLAPRRTVASATPSSPVRAGVSHRNRGQWYRYAP